MLGKLRKSRKQKPQHEFINTTEQVVDTRVVDEEKLLEKYEQGAFSPAQLAEEFNVSVELVAEIVQRLTTEKNGEV